MIVIVIVIVIIIGMTGKQWSNGTAVELCSLAVYLLFQRFIMILTEHIVRSEQQQLDVDTHWFKYTTERLREVFIMVKNFVTITKYCAILLNIYGNWFYFIHTEIFASNFACEKAFRILLPPIREAKRVFHTWKSRFRPITNHGLSELCFRGLFRGHRG